MAHVIEPAATARSKCRGCGARIDSGVLRFGEVLPNPFADGDTTHWFHLPCAAYKRPEPLLEALAARAELATLTANVEALPDQETLRKNAERGVAHPRLARITGAERAPSGRAACRSCKAAIPKDAWRIALVFYEDGRFSPAGAVHPGCAFAYFESDDVLPRVRHFAPGLSEADLAELAAGLKPS
jgi:hypothetical protein